MFFQKSADFFQPLRRIFAYAFAGFFHKTSRGLIDFLLSQATDCFFRILGEFFQFFKMFLCFLRIRNFRVVSRYFRIFTLLVSKSRVHFGGFRIYNLSFIILIKLSQAFANDTLFQLFQKIFREIR